VSCLGLSLADRDAASGAEDPDMRLRCPFRQGESPRFCRCPKFRTGRSIAPGRPKVWPSTWSPLAHTAGCTAVTRAAHGTAHCIAGCIRGCIGVCLTVSLPFCLTVSGGVSSSLSSPVGGSTIEITQFPVFFANSINPDLPGDPSPGSHRITYSIIGSRRSDSHHVPAPSPLLGGGMAARKRDRGQNFTPPQSLSCTAGAGVPRMSVLTTIGICWLGLNGAVFAALATRKSRPRLRARLFNWVIRNDASSSPAAAAFARVKSPDDSPREAPPRL
jgi:hypothetical protein